MLPSDPRLALALEWLDLAEGDLAGAERLAQSTPRPLRGLAAYHCQQAFEKALKGYLSFQDVPFRRTHELPELLAECEALDAEFARLATQAALLNPYSVRWRYPPTPGEPSEDQINAATAAAREAIAFVRARLPRSASP
ncbi:MAG: HEPN domain-containing protein [Chloroflexi bacterium]|nr:HEPN domain-containing protein [Chloroflexota bacterium]